MVPLSAKAHEALDKLWRHGHLHRKHGGYWTYKGCPDTEQSVSEYAYLLVPSWYALTTTLRELVEHGRARWRPDGEAIEYVPSGNADETESP